ncbi:amidohydrolase family protein [Paenibacillus koleovorans]|uniref:amidohydrolase family protein n=1 Tax=Paenibacillus koleovorans TaxID=121608 RepID=UPI000FD7D3D6|nr:amidohydrolase family protein [Paenibacillus koleovorans]
MGKSVNGIIDVGVWTGNWPFVKLRYTELPSLQAKLRSVGVRQAFVAPIEGILEQDPLRANRELLEATRGDGFFSPVPIVDLSYANWREVVGLAAKDGRVKIVKLLPGYHMYEVNENVLEPLVELTQAHKLIISIQMRLEDKRGMYPLLKVEDLDVVRVVKAVSYFTEQPFILSYPYMAELAQVLKSVDNLFIEIAGVEHADVLLNLKDTYSLRQVLFGSHAPFLIPEAIVAKLRLTDVQQADVDQVAFGNAERLLSWFER